MFDKTGALSTTKRHDYLPFGEELSTGQGVRTTTLGYGAADGVRQKFTSQERDNETGLDYMHARYFASMQGRFTSADTVASSIGNPQSLNRYAYVGNNPMNFSGPNGHMPSIHLNPKPGQDGGEEGYSYAWDDPNSPQAVLQDLGYTSADKVVSTQLDFSPAENPGFVPYYSILYGGLGTGEVTSAQVTGLAESQTSLITDKTTNPEDYYLMALLVGETTSWGKVGRAHQYDIDQSGKSLKEAGAANGPLITEDVVFREMIYMVSAVINRMGASNSGDRISKIASGEGLQGFKKGEALLKNGGAPHRQIAFARAAIDFVRSRGSVIPEKVQYWKAVVQGSGIRPWRDGIDYQRVGGTELFHSELR